MNPVLKRRMPAYLGGLLLSLGAMIVIMQAKKAFAPVWSLCTCVLTKILIGPSVNDRSAFRV